MKSSVCRQANQNVKDLASKLSNTYLKIREMKGYGKIVSQVSDENIVWPRASKNSIQYLSMLDKKCCDLNLNKEKLSMVLEKSEQVKPETSFYHF